MFRVVWIFFIAPVIRGSHRRIIAKRIIKIFLAAENCVWRKFPRLKWRADENLDK